MPTLVPVILAGGKGKRLWPLSSDENPKQFLKLSGCNHSLLQMTIKRALIVAKAENIITVSSSSNKDITHQQLLSISNDLIRNILFEERSCNTAFSIISAAKYAMDNFDYPVLWVMPSDHVIGNPRNLVNAIEDSLSDASYGKIISFGINPKRADSNYGYIKVNNVVNIKSRITKVDQFIEKPSLSALKPMLAQGNIFVNSGMFLVSAETLLNEFKTHSKDILKYSVESYKKIDLYKDRFNILRTPENPNINFESIDKAIMEKSSNLFVRKTDLDWMDIGSWYNLWLHSQKSGLGNNSLEKFISIIKN